MQKIQVKYKFFYIFLILLFFNGCSFIVGGDCNYVETEGNALIKSKNNHTCIAIFLPKQGVWREWKQKPNAYDIETYCSDKIKIGQSYPAVYKKATHSSCTPYFLTLKKEVE